MKTLLPKLAAYGRRLESSRNFWRLFVGVFIGAYGGFFLTALNQSQG